MNSSTGLDSIRRCFAVAANQSKQSAAKEAEFGDGLAIADAAAALKSQTANRLANAEVNNNITRFLLGGLAGGAALRGGVGLANLLSGKGQGEDLVEAPLSFQAGHASEPAPTPLEEEPSSYSTAGGLEGLKFAEEGWGPWLLGKSQEQARNIPWVYSGPALGAMAGGYAGWKGLDYLLNQQRKSKLQEEEDRAKEEYALAMQHMSSKMSRDQKLKLLYDAATDPEAFAEKKADGFMDPALAALATPIPFMALGSAGITYKVMEARRKSKLLEKALKQRQKDRLVDSPVFAYTPPEASPAS